MGIQDELSAALLQLTKEMPDVRETQRLTMLAGNGLAQPLTGLRANQARREYERLAKRYPKDHPRRIRALARAEAAKVQVSAIDSEIDRLKVAPKVPAEGETAVHGYIRNHGEPLAGIEVVLFEAGTKQGDDKATPRALSCTETYDDGSFALSAKSAGPLLFGVRQKSKQRNRVLHLDDEAIYRANGISAYRILDLSIGEPEENGKGSKDDRLIEDRRDEKDPIDRPPGRPDPILTDDLRGRTLHAALEALKERELGLTGVYLTEGDVSTPEVIAVEAASSEPSVILHVATGNRPSARLDAIAALLANDANAQGTEIDTVSGAREWLRAIDVGDLKMFATWSNKTGKEIQQKGKLKKGQDAPKIKRALASTRRLIREG